MLVKTGNGAAAHQPFVFIGQAHAIEVDKDMNGNPAVFATFGETVESRRLLVTVPAGPDADAAVKVLLARIEEAVRTKMEYCDLSNPVSTQEMEQTIKSHRFY